MSGKLAASILISVIAQHEKIPGDDAAPRRTLVESVHGMRVIGSLLIPYLSVLAYLRWNYRTHRGAETYRLPHDITRYNYLTRRECRGGEVVNSEVG